MNNTKTTILISYRRMIKLAGTLNSYNFREYFIRKTQHEFRTSQSFNINDFNNKYAELSRIILVQNMF